MPPSHSPGAWIWSEGADHAKAEHHLKQALEDLRSRGLDVTGEVGDANPLEAIGDVLRREPAGFEEIVMCTLAPGLSRRVGRDLPHRIERTFSLPVHQVTASLTRSYRGQEIPQPGTYAIDRTNSSIAFVARFLMISKVRGRFGHFAGELHIAEVPEDSSVRITIDATSVSTDDSRRDAHLRSADFLDVDRYPTLTFTSTGVEPRAEAVWRVEGDLTLHGTTRSIGLDVEFTGVAGADIGEHRAGFSASAALDREDWGLTWNQPLDAGGVLIGRKVHIELDVQVVRTPV
ncbi:MAG: YceI family protein [Acidimicrobiales bacterium]